MPEMIQKNYQKAKAHIIVALSNTSSNISPRHLPTIIDGSAKIVIDDKKLELVLGEGIIVPAYPKHCINTNQQFKMISVVIKSGHKY